VFAGSFLVWRRAKRGGNDATWANVGDPLAYFGAACQTRRADLWQSAATQKTQQMHAGVDERPALVRARESATARMRH
jgi:hypothetical protein